MKTSTYAKCTQLQFLSTATHNSLKKNNNNTHRYKSGTDPEINLTFKLFQKFKLQQ